MINNQPDLVRPQFGCQFGLVCAVAQRDRLAIRLGLHAGQVNMTIPFDLQIQLVFSIEACKIRSPSNTPA